MARRVRAKVNNGEHEGEDGEIGKVQGHTRDEDGENAGEVLRGFRNEDYEPKTGIN